MYVYFAKALQKIEREKRTLLFTDHVVFLGCTLSQYFVSFSQWRGGSEAAGEAPRIMAPPSTQSCFFCLLVWDAYYVVGTTCNDRRSLRNTFEWMGRYKPPSDLWREGPKNLHLTVTIVVLKSILFYKVI